MFCMVTRVKTAPENLDKLTKIIQEQVPPMAKKFAGFKGFYFMTNAGGNCVILDIFETEAQTTAFLKSPEHGKLGPQIGPLFAGPPAAEGFEVKTQVLPGR